MDHRLWIALVLCTSAACASTTCPAPAAAPVSAPVIPAASQAAPVVDAQAAVQAPAADTRVVVIEGAPAFDAQIQETLRRYTNVRLAMLEGLTDDGKGALITTRFGDTAQLHYVASPMGARQQLTFEEEPIADARVVPRTSDTFIYVKDVGGAENYQLYRFDRKLGKATLLTDGKSRTEAVVIARDGKQVAYASNRRNGRDMDIYVSDGVSAASSALVLEREGTWVPMDVSPDGKALLVAHDISINDRPLYHFDLATKALTRLSPESPTAAYRVARFGVDGRHVYLTSDREGEFVEAYELTLSAEGKAGAFRPLTRAIPWNVDDLSVSHDGRHLAIVTNEDGFSVLRLVEPKSGRAKIVTQIPRGILSGLTFAAKANVLGFTLGSATKSGDAFSFDVAKNTLTRFTQSELGGLDASRFVEPELVRVKSFDGREIPAFYYRPKGEGPFPVVIDIHGGPESQARPSFNPMTQFLVSELSVGVLVPNVRGSDGYGKSYLLLDNGDKREDSVKDIGAMLDWLGTRPEVNASKVGVYGASYGGYMVLASLAHYPTRIRAGVDVVGIANFVTFLENTSEYRRDLRRVEYGDERDPTMRAKLQAISPAHQVKSMQSALLVAHGANDPRVPASEAEQIVRAVRDQGHPVWYMLARNEGHGFRKKTNRDQLMTLMGMFWRENLREGKQP